MAEKNNTIMSPLTKEDEMIKDKSLLNSKDTGRTRNGRGVGVIDCLLVLLSLTTYLADATTDILVGVQYLNDGEYMWAILTLIFVAVPSSTIQIFSARWYAADNKMRGCAMWILHLLHLQPLERYIRALRSGLIARRTKTDADIEEYFYQQNDVCMLRLFEAFLESAPQLCLQIYIILCTENANWLIMASAVISLLALGWAVAAYSHALRRAYCHKYNLHIPALLLQTLWHMSIAAARVAAIVAFCSVFKAWIFLVLGFHWGMMTLWVVLQKTDFCPSRSEELLFNGVVGVIYCFCFFNLKEGATRWRMAAFYLVMLVENGIMVAVWYPFRLTNAWYNTLLLVIVFTAFLLGLVFMLIYYAYCHPNGPMSCWKAKMVLNKEDSLHEEAPQPIFKPRTSTVHLKAGMQPQLTSTGQLPRRNLLKCSHAQLPIAYREVATPITLTPIKPQRHCVRNKLAATPRTLIYPNSTPHVNDTSAFQHYSIDASLGIDHDDDPVCPSKCNTLDVSGVNLSGCAEPSIHLLREVNVKGDVYPQVGCGTPASTCVRCSKNSLTDEHCDSGVATEKGSMSECNSHTHMSNDSLSQGTPCDRDPHNDPTVFC